MEVWRDGGCKERGEILGISSMDITCEKWLQSPVGHGRAWGGLSGDQNQKCRAASEAVAGSQLARVIHEKST